MTHDEPREARPMAMRAVVVGGAAVVVVGAVVAALVLLPGDDDALPVADAAAALDRIVDRTDLRSGRNVDLDECPLGDVAAAVEALGVDGTALADRSQQVRAPNDDLGVPAGVACYAEDEPDDPDDELVVAVQASGAPRGDPEEELARGLPGDLRIEGRGRHHDGTVVRFCWRPQPDERLLCGAEWVPDEDDLAVTLSTTAPGVGAAEVADALRDVLPDVVEALAAAR